MMEMLYLWTKDLQLILDLCPSKVNVSKYITTEARWIRTSPAQLAEIHGDDPHTVGEGVDRKRTLYIFLARDEGTERHSPLDSVVEWLRELPAESRWLLLLGLGPRGLPTNRLVQGLTEAACETLNVAALDYDFIQAGAIGNKKDPRDLDAREQNTLRLKNEYVFTRYQLRQFRAHVENQDEMSRRLEAEIEDLRAEELPQQKLLSEERVRAEQLEQSLRRVEAQNLRLQADMEVLRRSRSYKIGDALVEAVIKPGRKTFRLPLKLLKLWREQEQPLPATARKAFASSPLRTPDYSEIWHGMLSLGTPRPCSMSVAGVLRPETARALRPDCEVIVLRPNEASLQLGKRNASLLMIESAASAPGSAWAGAGSFHDRARLEELFALLKTARAQRIAVIFYWNSPPAAAPFLGEIAERCDLVVTDDDHLAERSRLPLMPRGVQLREFNPFAKNLQPASETLFIGEIDPARGSASRALTDLLIRASQIGLHIYSGPGAVTAGSLPPELAVHHRGYLPADAIADVYRSYAVAIAAPARASGGSAHRTRVLEQMACGLRIIAPTPLRLGNGFDEMVRVVGRGDDLRGAVDELRQSVLRDLENSPLLRKMLRDGSVARFLDRLALQFGIDARFWSKKFGITLLAWSEDPAQLEGFAAGLLRQSWLPEKVVTVVHHDSTEERVLQSLSPLRGRDVRIAIVKQSWRAGAWKPLMDEVDTPWVGLWPIESSGDGAGDPYLLEDLLVRGICSDNPVSAPRDQATLRMLPILLQADAIKQWATVTDNAGQPISGWIDRRGSLSSPPAGVQVTVRTG